MSAKPRYDAVAITLHWVIALGIIFELALGWSMATLSFPLATKFILYQLHKSVGVTVLLAVVLRLLWRATHKPPAYEPDFTGLERKAAAGAHHLLYLAMLLIPLAGWAVVSLSPYNIPTVLYGHIPWPALPFLASLPNKAALEPWAEDVHAYLAYGTLGVVALHMLAALRHHFLKHDNILRRMAPWIR
jgi:cytochrome b561